MTDKPKHSFSAYTRTLFMRNEELFIFVEGTPDVNIYSRIIEDYLDEKGLDYLIIDHIELQNRVKVKESSGKGILLKLHEHLRDTNHLYFAHQKKAKYILFILDKDVDDFTNKLIDDLFIFYTPTYNIENMLFIYGDLKKSFSATADMAANQFNFLKNSLEFRKTSALAWKEWVFICFLSRLLNVNIKSYKTEKSLIHDGKRLIKSMEEKQISKIKSNSQLGAVDYKTIYDKANDDLEKMYDENEFDKIFNGKWYFWFATEVFKTISKANGRKVNKKQINSFPENLRKSLQTTINTNKILEEHYSEKIQSLKEMRKET